MLSIELEAQVHFARHYEVVLGYELEAHDMSADMVPA